MGRSRARVRRSSERRGWGRASLHRLLVGGLTLAVVVPAAMLTVSPASAATTFNVNTPIDEAPASPSITTCVSSASNCSLRAAITAADNLSGPVVIDVPAGTYPLSLSPTDGALDVGTAAGAAISIDGTGIVSITQVQPGTCTPSAPSTCLGVFNLDPNQSGDVAVTLSGLSITGGVAGGTNFPGGGAVIAGSASGGDATTLTDDTFTGNQVFGGSSTTPGGAVSQLDGSLTVADCVFLTNSSGSSNGGAIDYEAYDPVADGVNNALQVSGSTFTSNSAGNSLGGGGAIFVAELGTVATYDVTGSSFDMNQATAGSGGADGGGAILESGGTLTAESNNFVSNSSTASGPGGAVNVASGTATLTANRFDGNAAAVAGTALAAFTPNSPVVTANDNWWSSNAAPTATVVAGVAVSTWLELRLAASPTSVAPGGGSTLTADLTHDNANHAVTPTLPDGMAVTFSGTLGTPSPTDTTTASGMATATWTAGGVSGAGSATATVDTVSVTTPIDVDEAPVITSANSATFTVGTAGTFTVTTTGFPDPAVHETGALPAGVTLVDNGDGTATLAGTPGAGTGGTYPLTISATNGVAPAASQSFTLTVGQAPVITSANTATFTVGSAGTFTVTTTGFPTASLAESGALPAGVFFLDNGDGTATLAGTPGAGTGGTYPLTISANNGVAPAASQTFTLTAGQAPVITSANSATFTVGTAGTFTVTTTGFPDPAVHETGALPAGVTLVDNGDGTATLAGTPGAGTGGTYPLTISATNGVAPAASQSFTLTVGQAPVITSANTATFTVGSAGTFTVTTTGFPTASLAESGALPAGVFFLDNGDGTATLAGTPGAGTGGTYPLTISANNGVAPAASQTFTLTAGQAPVITSAGATGFTVGTTGTFSVTATGFPTVALTETGPLPAGVQFVDNGDGTATLAGDPGAGTSGVYPVSITAGNGIGSPAIQAFTLTVTTVVVTTTAIPPALQTAHYQTQLQASGGVTPYTWSVTGGALPAGINLSASGLISGVTTTTGSFPFTVTVADSSSSTASASFTLVVTKTGYWQVAGNGAVFSVGGVGTFGSMAGRPLNKPITGVIGTPGAGGYWMVGGDGGVFAFGDAQFRGSMAGTVLNAPIVGIVATPTGQGYWMVGGDGGVFAFGEAQFRGSMAGTVLNAPIVGIVATPTGQGYWMVGGDGGVFAFGDAQFRGSMAGTVLNAPIVGIVATPTGQGYWMVGRDGGVFAFGDARYLGGLAGKSLSAPVVSIVATADGNGYWLTRADGTSTNFGDAPAETPSTVPTVPIVGSGGAGTG